jgi:hypothetical protein
MGSVLMGIFFNFGFFGLLLGCSSVFANKMGHVSVSALKMLDTPKFKAF